MDQRRRRPPAAGSRPRVPNQFRQPEIRHLHAPAAVEQNVLRLDVAVDDALVVGELQRVANLRHDGQRLARRNAAGVEQLPQVHAVHEFHEEIKQAVRPAEFVNRHDAGMIELRQRLGFAGEAFGKRGVVADAGRQNFQRDDAVQFLLPRLVNRAHAALADEFEDFELRKLGGEFGDGRRLKRRLSSHR